VILGIEGFELLTLPDMAITFSKTPSKQAFAELQITRFVFKGASTLSFAITERTFNPSVLQEYINAFIYRQVFPVDVLWTAAGKFTIFESYAFTSYLDYSLIADPANNWASGGDFEIDTSVQVTPQENGNTLYEAVLTVSVDPARADGELFNTHSMPLFYKNAYFADAVIWGWKANSYLIFNAGIQIYGNNTVVDEIWDDLQNNRLPPGLVLIAVGNPNYPLGDVIWTVINYFSNEDIDDQVSMSSLGNIDKFIYGANAISAWLDTSITIGDGLIDAFQLDELMILPNLATLNATQLDGTRFQATMISSFFPPLFEFEFAIVWDSNHTTTKKYAVKEISPPSLTKVKIV